MIKRKKQLRTSLLVLALVSTMFLIVNRATVFGQAGKISVSESEFLPQIQNKPPVQAKSKLTDQRVLPRATATIRSPAVPINSNRSSFRRGSNQSNPSFNQRNQQINQVNQEIHQRNQNMNLRTQRGTRQQPRQRSAATDVVALTRATYVMHKDAAESLTRLFDHESTMSVECQTETSDQPGSVRLIVTAKPEIQQSIDQFFTSVLKPQTKPQTPASGAPAYDGPTPMPASLKPTSTPRPSIPTQKGSNKSKQPSPATSGVSYRIFEIKVPELVNCSVQVKTIKEQFDREPFVSDVVIDTKTQLIKFNATCHYEGLEKRIRSMRHMKNYELISSKLGN